VGDAALISLLREQLAAANKSLLEANVEISRLKESQAQASTTAEAFAGIVARSASNMSVALGGAALDYSTAAHTQLLSEHQRLSAAFTAKFKAGGVAAPDVSAANAPSIDPLHFARLKAIRPQPRT
jgi:hypothetical protein